MDKRVIEMKLILNEWRIDEFFMLLDKYLIDIKKEDYKYLLINLFELCLLEKDDTFKILFDEIEDLSKDEYSMDAYIYIRDFYYYINQNKAREAEICFKIISNYLDNNLNIIEELNNILKRERGRLLLLNIVKQMNDTNEIIHVLENVSNTKKELIYLVLNNKEFSNLKVSDIGGNILLFRVVNLRQNNINYEEVVDKIINLYKNMEYQLCIDMANELFKDINFNIEELSNSRELFIVIAKSYYKLNIKKHLIVRKYLSIANYLNKYKFNYEEKYDYTNWIEELSISISNHKKYKRRKK